MYGYNSFYVHFFLVYFIYGAIIVSLFDFLYSKRRRLENSKVKIFFLALPLYFLGVFRGETVGGDLVYYLSYFDEMCKIDSARDIWSISSHEPGYKILTYLLSRISHSHRTYLIVTFTLSFIGPVYLIYKYSKMPFLSFILYYSFGFYTNTFNNVRQSIAISICFFSFGFLLNRNFRKFVLVIVLAALFHYSAIFLLVLYPSVNSKISLKKILIILIVGVVFYAIFRLSFITFLLNLLSYKYDAMQILDSSDGAGWNLFILYLFILFGELFLFYKYRKDEEKTLALIFFIYLQLFAVIFQIYAPLFHSMTRLSLYFYIPIIIAIPYIAYYFKQIRLKIIFISFVLAIVFLGKVYSKSESTGSNQQAVIPYVFIDKIVY